MATATVVRRARADGGEHILGWSRQQGSDASHALDSSLRAMTPRLGKMHRHTAAKAERILQWRSRPAVTTLVDCAQSLIAASAI